MTTERQIKANRLNGKKGGPNTFEGKSKSSMNAVKHFLTARSPVIQTNLYSETIDERKKFEEKMIEALNPDDETQRIRATMIADASWRLYRHQRLEEAISNDAWIRLLLGDNLDRLTMVNARMSEIQMTLSTIKNDITALSDSGTKGWDGPHHYDRRDDIIHCYHLREFLEKSILFNATGNDAADPIDESSIELIERLCCKKNVTLKEFSEKFQEFLHEQYSHWNTQLEKITMEHVNILNSQPAAVSETSFIISVASHPILQKAQDALYRLHQSLRRMLRDYENQKKSSKN